MSEQHKKNWVDIRNFDQRSGKGVTRLPAGLGRFCKNEEGSVVVMTLFIFLFMMVMAGLGIDTMRHEMNRAKLQATLDAAVLAGAGAPDGQDPKAIVEDYFAKANMADYLHEMGDDDVVTTLGTSTVTASASMDMDTYLMKLSGIKTLTTAAAASASERIPKLEISLVLDVSGSMDDNNKIENLRLAAKDFVTTVLNASDPGDSVISIVPFSTSVTPPAGVYETLAIDEKHEYSRCLSLEDNDYNHTTLTTGKSALSSGKSVNQQIYTSLYGGFENLNQDWRSCYTDTYFEIMPYSISEADLHNKIDTLLAAGNTTGSEGVKWGATMLDPIFRDVTEGLIANGVMDASLSHVPVDYNDPDTLKIIVMMGDGMNTTTYFFDKSSPQYRGKHSDLYQVTYQQQVFEYGYYKYNAQKLYYTMPWNATCGKRRFVCVYSASGPIESTYYLRDPNPYNGREYYNVEHGTWLTGAEFNDLPNTLNGFISSEQLDWEIAWGLMSPHYYGQVTGDWGPWNDYVGSEYVDGAKKNDRMSSVCSAARTSGIMIYTIGFEISQGGTAETALKDCASSNAHYYRAEGVDITKAFSSIAGNLQQLRLTQ